MMYSDKVWDHFSNPRNVGEIADADGVGEVGNATCGDIMKIYLKIEKDVITDVKFKTFGCGAAIATSSMATEMIKGKPVSEALKLTNKAVVDRMFMENSSMGTGTVDLLGPNSNGTHPVEFRYGYYTSLNPDYSYTWDMFICEGLGAGLPYVGDSAVVKLIVPFKLMSSDFQSSGTPVFFEKVKYTFIK